MWAVNEFSLKGVDFQKFCMNGAALCALGKDCFLELAPDFVGDILWEHLEILQKGKWFIASVGSGGLPQTSVFGCPVTACMVYRMCLLLMCLSHCLVNANYFGYWLCIKSFGC